MAIWLVIGVVFSPLAALMAFLITVAEYSHHFPDRKTVILHGLQMAAITFLVFMGLAVAAGYFFQTMVANR